MKKHKKFTRITCGAESWEPQTLRLTSSIELKKRELVILSSRQTRYVKLIKTRGANVYTLKEPIKLKKGERCYVRISAFNTCTATITIEGTACLDIKDMFK